jgi:hypothetical protein
MPFSKLESLGSAFAAANSVGSLDHFLDEVLAGFLGNILPGLVFVGLYVIIDWFLGCNFAQMPQNYRNPINHPHAQSRIHAH